MRAGAVSERDPVEDAAASAPRAARTSRWARFAPSMGWRAFISEIVIVVLGVAIALAAGEAVEDWNWRQRVKDAESRLQADLDFASFWLNEASVTQPCIDAQLEALTRRLTDSEDVLDPAPVVMEGSRRVLLRMPLRAFDFPVWGALLADGTANRFTRERQLALGLVDQDMRRAALREAEIDEIHGRLMVMAHPLQLDAPSRQRLLGEIEALRFRVAAHGATAGNVVRLIRDYLGSAPAQGDVQAFLDGSRTVQYCREQGLPLADEPGPPAAPSAPQNAPDKETHMKVDQQGEGA